MTQKSKISLIVLCLLGIVFSYSCTCRSSSYDPKQWSSNNIYTTATYVSVEPVVDVLGDSGTYLYVKITEGTNNGDMGIIYKPSASGLPTNFDSEQPTKLKVELLDGIYTGYFEKEYIEIRTNTYPTTTIITNTKTQKGHVYWGESGVHVLFTKGTDYNDNKILLKVLQ